MRAHDGGYFIRLSVYDRPGVFAAIARRMADKEISLESIVQHRRAASSIRSTRRRRRPVILVTYETTEGGDSRKALEAIGTDGHLASTPADDPDRELNRIRFNRSLFAARVPTHCNQR